MRKNLLAIGLFALSFSLNGQVLTYVGDQALVTVLDETLVYSGGGWQNAGTGKVNNLGDIMVVGSPTQKFDIASTADFRLQYSSPSVYGQLYIKNIPQGDGVTSGIIGKVNKDYRADANHSDQLASLGRQQTALPFYNYTIGDLKSTLGTFLNTTSTTLNYTGRFNVASIFKWNNSRVRYDQIAGADATVVGKPTDYYILPRRSQNAAGNAFTVQWDAANVTKTFSGTPSSDESSNTTVSITGAAVGINFGINGNNKNFYSERYNTYIIDPFRAGGASPAVWNADYGKNLYEFGNPFLTNMDLSTIANNETVTDGGTDDGIKLDGVYGIATFGAASVNWQNGVGSTYDTSKISQATVSGGTLQGGDVNALIIKPMSEFYIKMDGTVSSPTTSFNLNNTRRFAQTKRASGSGYSVTALKSSNIPSDKVVKQVAVVLRDASGNELGRTYYAVSPSTQTGASSTELQSYVLNYPIYTKEEISTGGADANQNYKLYINAANEMNFQGKEIPMVVQADNASSFAFELYEGGERIPEGQNFSNGKSFYIKKDNVITMINDGDTMTSNNGDYGLYYEKPTEFLGTSASTKSQTIIGLKDKDWAIRFASTWKSADVEVYSATGQLIHSKKNVSTTSDYIIPLNNNVTGLFLVRTTSDKGEVVVKKIVK